MTSSDLCSPQHKASQEDKYVAFSSCAMGGSLCRSQQGSWAGNSPSTGRQRVWATRRNGLLALRESPGQLPLPHTLRSLHHNLAYNSPHRPPKCGLQRSPMASLSPNLKDMCPCWPSSLNTLFYGPHSCHVTLNFLLPSCLVYLARPSSSPVL